MKMMPLLISHRRVVLWRQLSRILIGVVIAAWVWAAKPAVAESLHGQVVALADGDTLTVLDASYQQHKVRLAGIDAPEKRQPFGSRSRQALAAMVFRQDVAVEFKKRDRYGRVVGIVKVNGLDVGLEQVRNGLAWHYKAYQNEQSALDRALYADAEAQARHARRGLWRDALVEPPWEFRQSARRR